MLVKNHLIKARIHLLLLMIIPLNPISLCVADTQGDIYTVSGTNFPDTYASTPLHFDGLSESAGGMLITETSMPYSGTPGGITAFDVLGAPHLLPQWSQCGRIIELNWNTQSGGFIAGSPSLSRPSDLMFSDLDVGDYRSIVPTGMFITIRNNGDGVSYDPDPGLFEDPSLLLFGPHPTQGGTSTIFVNLPVSELSTFLLVIERNLNGMFDTEFFGPSVGYFEIAYALGLIDFSNLFQSANRLNGISLGVFLKEKLSADLNDDDSVDMSDLALIQSHLGMSGAGILGDLNGDGIVSRGDIALFATQFGRSSGCAGSSQASSPAASAKTTKAAPQKPLLKVPLIQKRIQQLMRRPLKRR